MIIISKIDEVNNLYSVSKKNIDENIKSLFLIVDIELQGSICNKTKQYIKENIQLLPTTLFDTRICSNKIIN